MTQLSQRQAQAMVHAHFAGLVPHWDVSASDFRNSIRALNLHASVSCDDLAAALQESDLLNWRMCSGEDLWDGTTSALVFCDAHGPIDCWQVLQPRHRLCATAVADAILRSA